MCLFLPQCSLTSAYVVIEVLQPVGLKKMTQDSFNFISINTTEKLVSVTKVNLLCCFWDIGAYNYKRTTTFFVRCKIFRQHEIFRNNPYSSRNKASSSTAQERFSFLFCLPNIMFDRTKGPKYKITHKKCIL